MKKPNFIDLFCGAGGLSHGFERAGFDGLLAVDIDQDFINTYNSNHRNQVGVCAAVGSITTEFLKQRIGQTPVDVVIGGPPCQGFSTVGKGDVKDPRNGLFLEFHRIVKILNPKVVVFENVTGILAKKNELVFEAIVKLFGELGYVVDARVLAAEEYGVPERRRRAIIICSKVGMPLFPEITHGQRGLAPLNTIRDALLDLRAPDGRIHNHHPEQFFVKNPVDSARIRHIPAGAGIRYQGDQEKYLPQSLWYDVDWSRLPEGRFRQAKLQRLCYSGLSFTIMTSRKSYIHPTEDRYLTVREAAAIQTFPNGFIFKGPVSSQFKQVGNAVPVLLAERIAERVNEMLECRHSGLQRSDLDQFKKGAFHYRSHVTA